MHKHVNLQYGYTPLHVTALQREGLHVGDVMAYGADPFLQSYVSIFISFILYCCVAYKTATHFVRCLFVPLSESHTFMVVTLFLVVTAYFSQVTHHFLECCHSVVFLFAPAFHKSGGH